jgi:hypothetical protein
MTETSVDSAPFPVSLSHARARLFVGMSAVGSIVIASLLGLAAFAITNSNSGELTTDLPIVSILLLYLFYLSLQATADLCGGVIIPLVFQKRREGVVRLGTHLGLGVIRHGMLNIAVLGVLLSGSILFGRLGLLVASVVNITTLLLLQRYIFQFIGATKLEKSQQNEALISKGLDDGFTGGVVDSIDETILLIPSTATGLDYEYKASRLNTVRKLQTKTTRILLPIVTNGTGCLLALYCMSFYQSFPVRDVILYSLCTTVWSFILLLVLPVFNRRAVLSLDRELVDSGLKYNEFELAVRIEDSRGEDEYARSTLVQSVFYPIPAPETRFNELISNNGSARFWIAFHQIARRSLYTSLGCGGFLSRSVHCNVGRPELWVISPSD